MTSDFRKLLRASTVGPAITGSQKSDVRSPRFPEVLSPKSEVLLLWEALPPHNRNVMKGTAP